MPPNLLTELFGLVPSSSKTLLFFWLRSRNISSLSLIFSNLVCNFLSFFVPLPVMETLTQNIWRFQKRQFDTFFVFKSIVNAFVGWTLGTMSSLNSGRGTKKERKLHTKVEKMSERLEIIRDLSQKKRTKFPCRNWNVLNDFGEKGSIGSLMILKVLKILEAL